MHSSPNRQLYPLEVNLATGESFIRLRQYKNIIVTPPRLSDALAIVPHRNTPEVQRGFGNLPSPYLLEHAERLLEQSTVETADILKHLEEAKDSEDLVYATGCPVKMIREVHEDGTEVVIGDIDFFRCPYGEVMAPDGEIDLVFKKLWVAQNDRLEVGDPEIIWSTGFYLAPSHHRQGIMSDAVGSLGVFRKNGFTLTHTIPDQVEANGEKRTTHLLEWLANP